VNSVRESSVEEQKAGEKEKAGAITNQPAESRVTLEKPQSDLDRAAQEESRAPLLVDFVYFLAQNKKWWLLPILVILVLLSVLMLLSTSAAAPFIYTLF
jgi:hypothetical protein